MTFSNISQIAVTGLLAPTSLLPIDRRLYITPITNTIGDARYISPITGDYIFNANGKIAGLVGIQQQVYLSLATALGSSASVNLGQNLNSIQVITSTINQDVKNQINLALSPLTTSGLITLTNIIVNKRNGTGIDVQVEWIDNTIPKVQSLDFGTNKVDIATITSNLPYNGISPDQVTTIQAWYRADQGINAPNGTVQAWFNRAGSVEEGILFDAARDAYQNTDGYKPKFNPSDATLNFLPSVTFTANTYLQTAQWIDGYVNDPLTILAVGYWKDNAATYTMFDGYGALSYKLSNVSGTLKIHETADATGSTTNTGAQIYIIVFNGASSYYRQNAWQSTSFTGNPGTTSPLGLTIGNSLANTNGGITLAELVVFSGELSKYYQDNLMQYAKEKYNISGII